MSSCTVSRMIALHLLLAGVFTSSVVVASGSALAAGEKPLKERFESEFGWDVNKTKLDQNAPQPERDICFVETGDKCQGGSSPSAEPGGFHFPEGVAVGPAPEHNIYVADKLNARIQVLSPSGEFLAMYGWDVNKSGTTQQEKDVCTKQQVGYCQSGQPVANGPAGEIAAPTSIAVDQSSGNVYVLDLLENRVEEYTATGGFVLMIGGDVNETKALAARAKGGTPTTRETEEENICTQNEIELSDVKCKSGVRSAPGSKVPGAIKPESGKGDLLAVGGPKDTLYVGDEGRVQEFEDNKYARELPFDQQGSAVPLTVAALAVDRTGNLYIAGTGSATVRKYQPSGAEVVTTCNQTTPACWPLTLEPTEASPLIFVITTLATDPAGHLAVAEFESYLDSAAALRFHLTGSFVNGESGELITGFILGHGGTELEAKGLAFSSVESSTGGFPLYAAVEAHEVIGYAPVPVAALGATGASCVEGAELHGLEQEGDVTMDCTLDGTVNPEGVENTRVWFTHGQRCSQLTDRSSPLPIATNESATLVSTMLEGVRPNEAAFCYRVEGEDRNNEASEQPLRSALALLVSPLVAPKVVASPSASFVHATSAVLRDELNPENARTEYFFEYAPGPATLSASCPRGVRHRMSLSECEHVGITAMREARCPGTGGVIHCAYGRLGTTLTATDLEPGTVYHYRLYAENESVAKNPQTGQIDHRSDVEDGGDVGEGTFETAPALAPVATTGPYEQVGTTTAVIAGSVNPEGRGATYSFELGIYNGEDTQLEAIFTGDAGTSSEPVAERLLVSGLQPGLEYAYRISVASAGKRLYGTTGTFKTQGVETVLAEPSVLAILPSPPWPFPGKPKHSSHKCRRGYRRNNAQQKCMKKKSVKTVHRVRKAPRGRRQ